MNINAEIKVEFILSPGDLIPKYCCIHGDNILHTCYVNFHNISRYGDKIGFCGNKSTAQLS